jgi:hypothetical protein
MPQAITFGIKLTTDGCIVRWQFAMPQTSPAWLCYGDYVCLSSRAGGDRKQKKYILGHSSPLVKLGRNDELATSLNFASLVFCENPATVPFTHADVSSGPLTFDVTTNVRDYWFEILPRSDYDMSAQLNVYNKQLFEANRRLKMLNDRKAVFLKATSEIYSSSAPLNATADRIGPALNVHVGRSRPISALAERGAREMLPMSSESPGLLDRRNSTHDPDFLFNLQNEIDNQIESVRVIKQRVLNFESKAKIEEQSNEETISRAAGDSLNFGSVIQLRHVSSKRFLSVTKQADRAVELSAQGRTGSLFYIERASGGVAAGTIKVPADEGVRIFLRSVASDAQYVRIESNTAVTESKFPLSLDIELDGLYSADACFQLGIGPPVAGDDRVEWTIQRTKCFNSESEAELDSDDDEDSGVKASEKLSGCQVVRLFHRFSDSYLCATASKIDRGVVFFNHRSECDASKGPGLAADSYWMVIDGDNDLSESGEDLELDSPVILQHVISGMVLVAVRHLPATSDTGSKATNHEDFLSDDDDNLDALVAEERLVKRTRNSLSRTIVSFLKAIAELASYCESSIGASGYVLQDFELTETSGMCPQMTLCNSGTNGDNRVKQWIHHQRFQVVNVLEDTLSTFLKQDDLTSHSISAKAQEIEYEVRKWFYTPIFELESTTFTAQQAIEQILQNLAPEESEHAFTFSADDNSQTRVSVNEENRSRSGGRQRSDLSNNRSIKGTEDNKTVFSDVAGQRGLPSKIRNSPNPFKNFAALIEEFRQTQKKNSRSEQPMADHLWTFHIMSPKRILKYRKILDGDPCIRLSAPFLLACRWNFCTKHEKIKPKEESRAIMANSLFGIEVKDSSEILFLLGHRYDTFDETKSGQNHEIVLDPTYGTSHGGNKKDVSMISFGLNSAKGIDSQVQSDMITQLFNVEFVSAKSSDSIKKGAQAASIVRNFCLQLSDVLGRKDLELYFAFLRRYSSRLIEALDFIARSCVIGGFDIDARSVFTLEPYPHGQSFFGSLGIIGIIFDVVQVFCNYCLSLINLNNCYFRLSRNNWGGNIKIILLFSRIGMCGITGRLSFIKLC